MPQGDGGRETCLDPRSTAGGAAANRRLGWKLTGANLRFLSLRMCLFTAGRHTTAARTWAQAAACNPSGARRSAPPRPGFSRPRSLLRWHWLRHYHRTRADVSQIRREVSKVAMGHAADPIYDHYRGLDRFAFHAEYAEFESGIDDALLPQKAGPVMTRLLGTDWGHRFAVAQLAIRQVVSDWRRGESNPRPATLPAGFLRA
jgi:hypothetical protein